MKSVHAVILLIVFTVVAAISSSFFSCGGGGGGGGVDQAPPPPSGTGTGANGVVIFWYPYDTNVAVGAGNAVQETSDHGFIVAGTQANDFSSPGDVFLMKTDTTGAASWKKRFAVAGGGMANAVQQTSDGGYIVVGETGTQTGNHHVYALKTDASGNAAPGWPKTYGASDSCGYAVLEVSNPNGYMIVGYQNIPQQNENVYVIRTDTTGSVIWEKSDYGAGICNGTMGDFGRDVAATPDGNYVIAGKTGCNGWKGFLLKIEGTQGSVIAGWPKLLGGTSMSSVETVYSVAVASDGFVLAGTRGMVSGNVLGPLDALVIKTDLNGNETWRRTYGGADTDEARSVVVTKDNDYLVVGYTQSYGGTVDPAAPWQYQDVFMIKLDANGNTVWQKVKGNRPMGSDFGGSGKAVSDGGFIVTGSSGGNVLLAKFDQNGDNIYLGATDLTITMPGTMGTINFGNAIDVAAAGVTAIKSARDVGATTVDLLIATLKGTSVSSFCTGGGSYQISPAPALPISAPSTTFTVSFTGCQTGPVGDTTQLDGSAAFIVTSVSGPNDITTATYTVEIKMSSIIITAASTVDTLSSTITGSMIFTRQSTNNNFAEASQSTNAASTLTFSEDNGTTTLTRVVGPFTMHDSITSAGAYSYGTDPADSATVDSGLGPLSVKVNTPIQGTSLGASPASGIFNVTAADMSQLTATITNGVAALAVDTNGDGKVDGNVSAPWDFLD
jgi:hypothetical protein